MHGDETYQAALAAKRGQTQLPVGLAPFADGVERRYGVRPLWIATDTIARPGSRNEVRPRLDIVFERTTQFGRFLDGSFNFDVKKQAALAKDFAESVDTRTRTGMFKAGGRQEVVGDLFVCFSDFESAALQDVHTAVPESEIDRIARNAGFGESYWQMSRLWGLPVIFLQTDADVERFTTGPIVAALSSAYCDLAEQYDEFGLLDRETTVVALDSKENFDANYASSWFYYWR
jgi:hypothetical protein